MVAAWQARETERKARLSEAEQEHARTVAGVREELAQQHSEVDRFKADLEAGRPEAIVDYFGLVLEASRYPDGFPKGHRLAFVPESKQLVMEYDLPDFAVVPDVKSPQVYEVQG